MSRARFAPVFLPLSIACAAMMGCGEPSPPVAPPAAKAVHADHDHGDHHDHDHDHDHGHEDHEHPETIAAGLAGLEKICREVKEELAEGDHEEADGKVHMVGHLLDDLRGLVVDAKPAADVEEAAKKALDDIFDCFDKMDTALHSSDPEAVNNLDYAEHAPAIEAAIQKLKTLFP